MVNGEQGGSTPVQELTNGSRAERAEVLDLRALGFSVRNPDVACPPTALAVSAHRLRSFRNATVARNPNLLREPFQMLAEVLHVPGRFAATVRIGVRGSRHEPLVESDLVVCGFGDDDIMREIEDARDQVEQHLSGPHAPFVLRRVELADLGWPCRGYASFIRQQLTHVNDGDVSFDLPLRFSFPGPDAPYRLLNALLAAGPGTDLFVTISPTALWLDEHEHLEQARVASESSARVEVVRNSATALDVWLSYRTDLYVLQLLVVSQRPLTEITLRAIASSLTAGYDAERRAGARVVARAERFLGGGFEIEPCRDSTEVLNRLRYGVPWIGLANPRELVDLVTSTEVGFTFAWLAGPDGSLPGVGLAGGSAPPVPGDVGTVQLGHDRFGSPARLTDGDRLLHTVVVGATGCGKTTMLVNLAIQDALAGRGVVVVDPHGDMVERIAAGLPASFADRTFYLDASSGELDHLNLLELYPAGSDRQNAVNYALVDGMVADLNRDFAGPVFLRIMRRLLHLASVAGGTLLDVERYLTGGADLDSAVARADEREFRDLAREIEEWTASHRAEMLTYVAGKLEWASTPGLRTTFAPRQSSFDLPAALQRGDVILVNPAADHISGEVAMSTFLEALLCCVASRRKSDPTVALYLDEVQRYCGHVVRRLANELRKRSVALHAATQNLTNLGQHLEALIGNAGNLVVGRCSGPTAGFAQSILGMDPSTMSAIPNFHAVARLAFDGQPCEPFELVIDRPTGAPVVGPPEWLVRAARGRRQRAAASNT